MVDDFKDFLFDTYACRQPAIFIAMSDQEQELSHQELYKLVLDQRKELEDTRKELAWLKARDFNCLRTILG